jgi:hypothetical protein
MTRDDIIRMAREAGYDPEDGGVFKFDNFDLERFAALVAAAERERFNALLDDYRGVLETLEEMQAAVAAERERLTVAAECFRVCKHKGVCDEKATSNEAN